MALNFPDLGIDWGKARQELHTDLGDVWGKVNSAATNTLGRIAQAGQGAGGTLGRIAQAGAGGGNQLARIAQAGGQGGSGLGRIAQVGYDGDSLGRIAGYGNYGGGNSLDFFSTLPDADPFANLNASLARSQATTPATAAPTSTSASGGGYGAHEQYRQYIEQYAAQQGIDPDALAAILKIETPSGDPHSVSSAGARGLGQIMPGTWDGLADPGDDPFDPAASIKNAAKYYASLYRQFGDYSLAAAAYQGGPGAIVNGQPRSDVSDGNMTPAQYAALFQQYFQGIKAAPRPTAGGGGSLGGITPGAAGSIMQEFGPTDYAAAHPDTYAYGNAYGLPGSQHPGVDWAVPLGTQVATPLGGTVYVVGNDHGSGYYYTNTMSQSDPDHSGEFAVMLDNGDVLILGHLSGINVQVGQKVTAGQLIGLSGGSDGAHVHVEYRQRQGDGSYRIIDPRTVLR